MFAAAIEIAGVVPPLETTGAVPVTAVTVPTEVEPPRLIAEPLIVIELFANCALLIVPDRFVVGIVVDAVAGDAPLPYK